MDKILDFTRDPRIFRPLGGTDRKIIVNHDGDNYMLKFPEDMEPRTDMTDSYANNIISEYISSNIAKTVGLDVHETVLGLYNGEVVVGCKDFRAPNEENIEFQEFAHAVFNSQDIKRVARLDQIYTILNDQGAFSDKLREQSIERFWDTFVIDSLVGNFDRHMGNWGYLSDGVNIRLAPIYDFGSTLLPKLSDEGINEIINNRFEMLARCMVYPSPALFILPEKAGKVGFYDLMASGYDKYCTKAVIKMTPRVDMNKINRVIQNTPFITDKRKDFYKQYIELRKEYILDRAYECCKNQNYDIAALNRVKSGHQYSTDNLKDDIKTTFAVSLAKKMEQTWHTYMSLPPEQKNGIPWNGEKLRPAVFDDMYLAQCQEEGREPDKKIYDHFWGNCVGYQEYEPRFCTRNMNFSRER